ncbi:MAG: hypothetical protein ABJP45_04045 [Cyclobacteriaceae bacterium]
MITRCLFLFMLLLIGIGAEAQENWRLVYANDDSGIGIDGEIDDLIKAVRDGKEIRLAWSSGRVEHVADAAFLTIMKDSVVVGQIDPIYGQTPNFINYTITLKENLEWVLIGGTNGKSDAMTTNKITGEIVGHNARNRAFKWFTKD